MLSGNDLQMSLQTIPFLSFDAVTELIKAECREVFDQFLERKHYVLGAMTRQFEQDYASFNQVNYCVGLSNGLDALQMALRIGKIGAGDEVIVPSNAYIAAVLAITHTGATPVFAEPDPLTSNMDPNHIASLITSRTRCIMPVHLYGQACRMKEIMDIASRHNLWVVEDNAQSQGASCEGVPAGAWGHVNATSFYPTKNLGALGEAGAITTQLEPYAEAARIIRNYGSSARYVNDTPGFNWRIDELQAGLLSVKLKYLKQWTDERRQLATRYLEGLSAVTDIQLPATAPGVTHTYHLFVIQCPQRTELQAFLQQQGISTLIHYPIPPHLQKAYQGLLSVKSGALPIAEQLAQTCLSLPLFSGMTFGQVDYVCQQIARFYHA